MIDVKELRIGNWVSDGFVFFDITEDDMIETIQYSQVNYGNLDVEPIELTVEWLIKFDLIYSELTKLYHCNGMGLWHKCNEFYLYDNSIEDITEFEHELCRRGLKVKYVHQLQNLYFALTNEELIIKN